MKYRLLSLLMFAALAVVSCEQTEAPEPDNGKTETPETPDNPQPEPEPEPEPETTGDVDFTIEIPAGEATDASPAVTSGTEPLQLTVLQTSSYTDPDGTVYTRQPEAVIGLRASLDTVRTNDLHSLVQVGAIASPERSSEEGDPVRHHTRQTFSVGGQEIAIELSHEVYTITNSLAQSIEMPYIKFSDAAMGSAVSEEQTRTTVSAVSLRPLNDTRAGTITEYSYYEVTVRFNTELSSVNTKEESSRPLVFAVSYVGEVETVTELLDPTMSLAWYWTEGARTVEPPFVWDVAEATTKTFTLNQTATYTNCFGTAFDAGLEASVTVTASSGETVRASSADALQRIVEPTTGDESVEGENPQHHRTVYDFALEGLTVSFDIGCDSGLTITDEQTGEPVAMAYVVAGAPVLKEITATKSGNGTVDGREAELYDVRARFAVELSAAGLGESHSESAEFVVSYRAAVDIKLVRVTYKRDWEWVEPHDNMALFYYAKVHRTRHYSTGESFTDTFMDGGHMAVMGLYMPWEDGESYTTRDDAGNDLNENDEGYLKITYGKKHETYIADSVWIKTRTNILKGPSIFPYEFEPNVINWVNGIPVGTWQVYSSFGRYYDEQTLTLDSDVIVDGDTGSPIPAEIQDRRSGWYVFADGGISDTSRVFINGLCYIDSQISDYRYDQYLLLDGRMFTFIDKELRPDAQFNSTQETIRGGWVFKHEMKMKYLGRNFSATAIDTLLYNP